MVTRVERTARSSFRPLHLQALIKAMTKTVITEPAIMERTTVRISLMPPPVHG